MGRPLKDIDERQVFRLAKIQCTHEEIAEVLGCSTDTLVRRFADCIKNGRELGKKSLRRAQYAGAVKGNPTLLIWLGKQYLGQTDKIQQEVKAAETTVVIKRPDDAARKPKPRARRA